MSEPRAEYEVSEATPDPFEWSLDSESEDVNRDLADWAMRKMYLLEQEISLVKAQHEELLTRLSSELTSSKAYFLPHLEHWAAKQVDGQKRKSLILPHGTAQFRTVKAGVKVVDKEAALAYALANCPDAVRSDLDVTTFKTLALSYLKDGELLPGIETTPERESFSVRFGKEKEDG